MPTLEVAIRDICAECAKSGQVVSEVLAAFVTRTVRYTPILHPNDDYVISRMSC
jgi:hypothetical protein